MAAVVRQQEAVVADTVLLGGKILTMDAEDRIVAAVGGGVWAAVPFLALFGVGFAYTAGLALLQSPRN